MTFDFSMPGKVKVSMDDYIDKVLTGFPKEVFESAPSPAGGHLFKHVMKTNERYSQRSRAIYSNMLFHIFCLQHFVSDETYRLLSHSYHLCEGSRQR